MTVELTDRGPRPASSTPARGRPRRKCRRFVETQDFLLSSVVGKLDRGVSLERRLTRLERLTIAVAAAWPSHFLTIDSALGRNEFMRDFEKLKARIRRDRHRPLLYFGTVATSMRGAAGYHAHLLLWRSLHYNMLHRHVRELGLGSAHVAAMRPSDEIHAWPLRVVAYAAGQQQAVFGGEGRPTGRDSPPNGEETHKYPARLVDYASSPVIAPPA